MKRLTILAFLCMGSMLFISCADPGTDGTTTPASDRQYTLERVGPARVVQLYADGFEDLSLRDKIGPSLSAIERESMVTSRSLIGAARSKGPGATSRSPLSPDKISNA